MSLHRNSRVPLNDGWSFRFEDDPDAGDSVSLPHSWNSLDTMDVDPSIHYRRAIGTYRRTLPRQDLDPLERLWIEFEAASQKATVQLNGRSIGEHIGGYTAFTVELREAAGSGDLLVRVDNRPDPDLIPSDLSDFYLYGGLTRNAWFYRTGPVRIAAAWIDASVSAGAATLMARGRLEGDLGRFARLTVELRSPGGELISQVAASISSPEFAVPLEAIENPECWSPSRPAMYRATLRINLGAALSDEVEIAAGLRWFDFPADGLFHLNGEPLRLHGTHRHEDWAGHGGAVPDALTRRELELIQSAGFNFVRLGHYPQSAAALDACDELGLIVWEELPWCRGGVGGEVFQQRARRMLVEMIEQHRQHPSIVFWGLGNELDWEVNDHSGSTEPEVLKFLVELNALAKELDPDRLTALRRFTPGAPVVDVYSPSIWSGWYRGRYEDYETVLSGAMNQFPRMLHIEWGSDSHFGRHSSGPHVPELSALTDHGERPGDAALAGGEARASRDGDWSESYTLDLMEWHLQVQLRSARLPGNAQWVFKDFGTPLRPENPIPYVNQKGLIDRAGRPKDAYYLFQSNLSEAPMVHIESPTWRIRMGDESELQRVRVYSNCGRVGLFLNGEALGVRQRDQTSFPAAGLVWRVPFRLGRNELRAVGEHLKGRIVEHSIEVSFEPRALGLAALIASRAVPGKTPGGDSATQIDLQLCDSGGRPVDDSRRISLRLTGPGKLLTHQGTADGSAVVELANGGVTAFVLDAVTGVSRLQAGVVNGPQTTVSLL